MTTNPIQTEGHSRELVRLIKNITAQHVRSHAYLKTSIRHIIKDAYGGREMLWNQGKRRKFADLGPHLCKGASPVQWCKVLVAELS